ncbi:MAG: SAM-dependent methyltransferase [Gammaproteobacteria bacterium]|nr:SAM-dependent methyltransferase [Gammaproteobacteria bacterium]
MAVKKAIPAAQAVKGATVRRNRETRAVSTKVRSHPVLPEAPPYGSVLLISAATLAYEILLTRLLSIVQWQHFAFMIVSLALLGLGAGGMWVAFARRRLLPRFSSVYLTALVLFGLTTVASFIAVEQIPFNLEEVLQDKNQPLILVVICALLGLPFFFSASALTLCLVVFHTDAVRIHTATAIGAGAGTLLIFALLFTVVPDNALRSVGALGLAAAALAWWELRVDPRMGGAIFALMGIAVILLPGRWTELQITPNKSLPQILQVGGAQLVSERSSPLGLVSVVENTLIPWRYAPGLSLQATHEPPEQVGVFTDGDALTVITRPAKNPAEMDYLDQTTSALPYHLHTLQHVLVVGAGGGNDVLQARMHNVPLIEAVEINPQIAALVRGEYSVLSGELYASPDVKLHISEPRSYIAASDQKFDLIQIPLLNPVAATSSGRYALAENYLYTVEALREYLAHLEPNGYLAITRWINVPPRDTLKLLATAAEALERGGIRAPSEQLFLLRSSQTATLIVKNSPYSTAEIATLQAFCRQYKFDLGYYPGMQEEDAHLFNITDRAYFFAGAQALLGERKNVFMDRYKYNLEPATDDRPYFFHFFKWKSLNEMLAPPDTAGMALMEWGYLVLVATFITAAAASLLIIFLPLLFSRSMLRDVPRNPALGRVMWYFLLIGAASTLLQMALIQKFMLLLYHPVHTLVVVLTTTLLFSGLGSLLVQRFAEARHHLTTAFWAVAVIAALCLLYVNILGPLFDSALAFTPANKILLTIGLIAPLAFCMGLPLPLALDMVGSDMPAVLPWAMSVNQCASVFSAAGTMLLAMHAGFTLVFVFGLVLYGLALLAFPKSVR